MNSVIVLLYMYYTSSKRKGEDKNSGGLSVFDMAHLTDSCLEAIKVATGVGRHTYIHVTK